MEGHEILGQLAKLGDKRLKLQLALHDCDWEMRRLIQEGKSLRGQGYPLSEVSMAEAAHISRTTLRKWDEQEWEFTAGPESHLLF